MAKVRWYTPVVGVAAERTSVWCLADRDPSPHLTGLVNDLWGQRQPAEFISQLQTGIADERIDKTPRGL